MELYNKLFKTKNLNVNIILKFTDDLNTIFIENFDSVIDLNVSNSDSELSRKFCNLLVECYNEGLSDGKNSVFLEPSLEGADVELSMRDTIKFPTINKEAIVILEKYEDNDYTIYINSFNQRLEFIIYNKDIELMTNYANALVKVYNYGYRQGQNEAKYF